MITVFRYRTMKSEDGQIEFVYHRDGTIIGFVEYWNTEKGWETVIDVVVDTDTPVERRRFFLCTAGDRLDALGPNAFAYHVATHEAKGYCSYLFDITHLPDQLVAQLHADKTRLRRSKPEFKDMGRIAKAHETKRLDREETQRSREENRRRRDQRLANTRETTDQLVESRQAADQEREAIEQETHLRVVGDA